MNHRKTALTETMAFRLPHDMCERLRKLEGVSMTQYVTAALRHGSSIDLRDNIMNRVIVTPSKTARQAAQQAAQAAMLLNRAGFHAQAKAIWDAAKGVIAQ